MGIDTGSFARHFAELVAHGVLDFKRGKIEAAQRAFNRSHVDAYGARYIKPVCPWQRMNRVVYILFAVVSRFGDAPQYAAGRAAVKVNAIAQRTGSTEMHTTIGGVYLLCAESFEFIA